VQVSGKTGEAYRPRPVAFVRRTRFGYAVVADSGGYHHALLDFQEQVALVDAAEAQAASLPERFLLTVLASSFASMSTHNTTHNKIADCSRGQKTLMEVMSL